ncbi:MAG: Efflux transporter, family, subunit [Parcubacteria group bacterium]|nr:Efflux transporter, family, subunit [Parcubacteria group bacterium]
MKTFLATSIAKIKQSADAAYVWALAHKVAVTVIAVIVIGGGYYAIKHATTASAQTRYVLATATKGTVITSVSGTGQVSASNQVAITSKMSGQLIAVPVVAGQTVKAGQLIAEVDPTTAAYELESARISYDTLVTVKPADVNTAKESVSSAQENLDASYVSARTALINAMTSMTSVLTSTAALYTPSGYLSDQLYSRSPQGQQLHNTAEQSYYAAQTALDSFTSKERTLSASSANSDVESLLASGYSASIAVVQAANDAGDAIAYNRNDEKINGKDTTIADKAYTTATSNVSSANSVVSSISNAKNSISSAKRSLTDANTNVTTVVAGADVNSVRAQTLALRQKQQAYADYFTRAPFDGVLATVDAHVGDTAGASTQIATIITKNKIAKISLNEVDAAKVKIGDKATLTFDAIDGLTITGTIAQMDLIGTVTQGVVSYTVTIAFDTDDDRIKPGMTVSADIVTDIQQDVLTVPTAALHTSGNTTYVETLPGVATSTETSTTGITSLVAPTQIPVSIGLSGDDTTEILSGLTEGDVIVARTIAGTTAKTAATKTPSLLGGGTGAGATRAVGGNAGFGRGG